MKTKSRQRIASEARAVAGWMARESGCVTLSALAGLVNLGMGSIGSAVRRLSERIQEDPGLAGRISLLKSEIEGITWQHGSLTAILDPIPMWNVPFGNTVGLHQNRNWHRQHKSTSVDYLKWVN